MLTISKSSLSVISRRSNCLSGSKYFKEFGNRFDFLAIKKNIKRIALHHAKSNDCVTFLCIYCNVERNAHTISYISILRWGSLALIDQKLYDNMTIKHIYEIDYLVFKSQQSIHWT